MSLFLEKNSYHKDFEQSLRERLLNMSWSFFALICLIVFISLVLLYSIDGGGINSFAGKQLIRFLLGCSVFFAIALSDLRFWMKYAYWFYAVSLLLLVAVDFIGHGAMGAQRWLSFGGLQIQPSEIMKIALVLALARYFHSSSDEDVKRTTHLIIPLILLGLPVSLILLQPDLGTALMLVFVTVAVFWIVGVQWWKFAIGALMGVGTALIGWNYFLHDYQKNRVLTFLDPERDPLGTGYHIMQSKITMGSGGVFGKGFMQGTQSHLNFIPEKQTDFIFTVLAEEFGLIGAAFLLLVYMIIIFYGIRMSLKSCNFFGKILGLGLTVNFALYVFINISMVMGVMPVVGIPLPLVSYGGSAMLVLMAGFGLIESIHVNEEMVIDRLGVDKE